MRKLKNYEVTWETPDDMVAARRVNPGLEITFRRGRVQHKHKINAGYADDIHVYREGNKVFVLSGNDGLGYVGLEVFAGDERAGNIFLQGDQVKETLGRSGLSPSTMIRRLLEFVG
jgi:hypothetical protein